VLFLDLRLWNYRIARELDIAVGAIVGTGNRRYGSQKFDNLKVLLGEFVGFFLERNKRTVGLLWLSCWETVMASLSSSSVVIVIMSPSSSL